MSRLAIITDMVGDALENSLADRAAYKDVTRLIKTIDDGELYTTYAVDVNKLLCRLGPLLCVLPDFHLFHIQERLLSSKNKKDTTELRKMRLLLVALYAIACYSLLLLNSLLYSNRVRGN